MLNRIYGRNAEEVGDYAVRCGAAPCTADRAPLGFLDDFVDN